MISSPVTPRVCLEQKSENFQVTTWHYQCSHNLNKNCIWDNLQCCLLVPRSPSKPVMWTFDLPSRKVLFIEIVFWHVKADLFSQKWTQHHMDWNRLSTMDPIFGIYFRCILNWLCLFLNLGKCSLCTVLLWVNDILLISILLLCTHQGMSYYVLIASRSDACYFHVLSWLCIWMFVHSVYIVYMLLLVGD